MSLMTKKEPGWLARRVKELRDAAGISQQELAQRAKLSISVVTQVEQGKTLDPRISTLRSLARGLGVPVADLVERNDEKEPDQ